TRTTTVLSCLSLTTVPCSMRFGILLALLGAGGALFAGHGREARDVATHLTHPRGVFQLARRFLEAQVELFLLQLDDLLGKLVGSELTNVFDFHLWISRYWMRATKRVLMGSLAAARRSASRAVASSTPSSSNMMRPGLMRAAQNSGWPLPLPMRT